jgi:hypothetical protein
MSNIESGRAKRRAGGTVSKNKQMKSNSLQVERWLRQRLAQISAQRRAAPVECSRVKSIEMLAINYPTTEETAHRSPQETERPNSTVS